MPNTKDSTNKANYKTTLTKLTAALISCGIYGASTDSLQNSFISGLSTGVLAGFMNGLKAIDAPDAFMADMATAILFTINLYNLTLNKASCTEAVINLLGCSLGMIISGLQNLLDEKPDPSNQFNPKPY